MRIAIAAAALAILAAGCILPPPAPPEPGPDFQATDPSMPGVIIKAQLHETPDSMELTLEASNEGRDQWTVEGTCYTPWAAEIQNVTGTAFDYRGPFIQCYGISYDPFPPGDRHNGTITWNRTAYYEASATWGPLPPGQYTWLVTFSAEDEKMKPARIQGRLPFTVS